MERYSSVHPDATFVREASGLYGPSCRRIIKLDFEFTVLLFALGILLLQTSCQTVDLAVSRSFIQGIKNKRLHREDSRH
jgi:hypothetical protein